MTEQETSLSRFSIILRFLTSIQEIDVTNIVLCKDDETHMITYKFIDTGGRMWHDVPFSDVIIINNRPSENDMKIFAQLEQDGLELSKKPRQTKVKPDVNVG